jgi:hypothetical protein
MNRKVSMANSFSLKGDTYIVDEVENYRFRTVNINTHIDGSTSYDICGRSIAVKKAVDNVILLNQLSSKAA